MATDEKLAIHGGPRAVRRPPVERWTKFTPEVKRAVLALLDAGVHTIADGSGVIGEFERAFAAMVGTRHAVVMNSGTATLHSAYVAVGVGPGDEVVVPSYTWHATITPILHCGATPVFCDIDPATLTADPDDAERRIGPRTRALCVVHVWGNVCAMDRFTEIAGRHGIALIEDASHAHGASWQGRGVGSFGRVGCFSLQGVKAVSGGEAGVAVTDDPELLDRMLLLGHFGRKRLGASAVAAEIGDMSLGAKYRAHPWAVAMALEELKRLPELNRLRTRNYELLDGELEGCPGLEPVRVLPGARRGGFLEYKWKLSRRALAVADRARIVEAMAAEGVPIHADRYSSFNYTYGLLHAAPLFTRVDRRSLGGCFYDPSLAPEEARRPLEPPRLPVAEDMAGRLVSIDAFTDVTEESLRDVAAGMRKVMERLEELRRPTAGSASPA